MERRALIVAMGGLLMTASIAMSQDTGGYPDMRGQWKGITDTIVLGSGTHHRNDKAPGMPRMHNQELTLNIKGQDGRKFWGEIVSKDDTVALLGIIASDKQTIYHVNNAGGHANGRLTGPNKYETCFLNPGKDLTIASCNVFTKQ